MSENITVSVYDRAVDKVLIEVVGSRLIMDNDLALELMDKIYDYFKGDEDLLEARAELSHNLTFEGNPVAPGKVSIGDHVDLTSWDVRCDHRFSINGRSWTCTLHNKHIDEYSNKYHYQHVACTGDGRVVGVTNV